MSKKLFYIIGGVIVVLLLIVLIVPLVVNVNQYRPQIESLLSGALNRKVQIGNVNLSILSGGVSVADLGVADDPTFGTEPFLTAKSVTVGVELLPLIFSRALHVTGLTIEQPQVTLLRTPAGKWNFSTLATSSSSPPAGNSSGGGLGAAAGISVAHFAIKDGTVNVGETGAKPKIHTYQNVNLTVSDLSTTTQFPFALDLKTPDNGSISLKGDAGPLNQTDMSATPLSANLQVKGLDVAASGFVDPSAGIAGLVDFTGTLTSDGKQVNTMGAVTANKLQLVPGASPASEPVQIDYATVFNLGQQTGTLTQGNVHVGKALAQLTGTYNTSGDTPTLQMKFTGKDMPAADLAAMLPAFGAALPGGAALTQGTLNADFTITGPVDKLVITGPVNLANAKLTGFDLGAKMQAVATLARLPNGSDVDIQTLSGTFHVATDGIRADSLNVVVPSMGSITGAGTISPNHNLDFKMKVALASGASPLGALGAVTSLGGTEKGGIPFHVGGTTNDPTFSPDFGGVASGIGGGAESIGKTGIASGSKVGGALGGLLKKKGF